MSESRGGYGMASGGSAHLEGGGPHPNSRGRDANQAHCTFPARDRRECIQQSGAGEPSVAVRRGRQLRDLLLRPSWLRLLVQLELLWLDVPDDSELDVLRDGRLQHRVRSRDLMALRSLVSSRRLGDVATAALLVVALALGGRALWREVFRGPVVQPRISREPNWASVASDAREEFSDSNAVTLVEFGDFECPFCREFALAVDSPRRVGMPIRLVYRHAVNHRLPRSLATARMSECAGTQGRFMEAYMLFNTSEDARNAEPEEIRVSLALRDSAAFIDCLRYDGMPSFDSLRAMIVRERNDDD